MKKIFILMDFKKMSDDGFQAKVTLILFSMSGNKSFPKPTPTLKALEAAYNKYVALVVAAKDGGSTASTAKNTQRDVVKALLVSLAAYVEFASDGDEVKMRSSGFTVSSTKNKPGELGDFTTIKLNYGKNSGEVDVAFKKVPGAVSYNYYITPTPVNGDKWEKVDSSTTANTLLPGLKRGVEYAIRIGAVGSKKQVTYSQPITIMVV